MAGGVGHQRGGIRYLRGLIAEHPSEVEYELIRLGLRLDQLGSPTLTWRDLRTIVRHAPEGSALRTAMQGYESWTAEVKLLALHINQFQFWVWLNSDPKKRGAFVVPLDIPGPREVNREVVKVAGVDRASADAWLAERRAAWATN